MLSKNVCNLLPLDKKLKINSQTDRPFVAQPTVFKHLRISVAATVQIN